MSSLSLTNPFFIAIGIPFLFLIVGGFIKKIIRGRHSWSDFYFGLELAFSTMGSSLINIADVNKAKLANSSDKIVENVVFLGGCIFCLMILISIHQSFESKPDTIKKHFVLAVVSNAIGGVLMWYFILYIKEIN